MCEITQNNLNDLIRLLVDIKNENKELKSIVIGLRNDIKSMGNIQKKIVNFSDIKFEEDDEKILSYLNNNSIISDVNFIKYIYFNDTKESNTIKLSNNHIVYWDNNEWINNEKELIPLLIKKLTLYYTKVNLFDNYPNMMKMINNQTYISNLKKNTYETKFKKKLKEVLNNI
jgi:hypothetical protein